MRVPPSCPPAPLCHSRRLLAGIQRLSLPSLSSGAPAWETHGFPITNVGNDRRGIEHVRHDGGPDLAPLTEGLLWPLCHARLTPLSYLLCPLCHTCRPLFVMPARPPLSYLPAPLCHTRSGPSVMPAGPPLSFPQVVSGNPASFSFVPFFGCPCMGKSHGFPITNVGNDRRGIEYLGHDGGPTLAPLSSPPAPLSCPPAPSVMPDCPPLSFPQVVSGNPGSFSSVPFFGCPCMGKTLIPD